MERGLNMGFQSITEQPGATKYGAQMGRYTGPDYLCEESGRMYLRRVRIDSGGYDQGGAYWGLGAPLYECQDQDGNTRIFRARDRDAAKAAIRADFPAATFFR
jgi:hypothetical protein